MAWTTPKTDWAVTDSFNIVDYNRIRNNLIYLRDIALNIFDYFDIDSMGADYVVGVDEDKYWIVSIFNAIETNLETINTATLNLDIGATTTFYENGAFIKASECNRIESATLALYEQIKEQIANIPRLSFTLGRYRLPKV